MHPNPNFRREPEERHVQFVRERGFGTLAINSEGGPLLSHVPFRLSDDAKTVELHLVRSNPIIPALKEPQKAVLSVTGPDAYVSPDWYGVEDQVPTWNYVAVHLRGTLSRLPAEDLHAVLSGLTAEMENRLSPKKPWTSDKMDQDVYQRMLRQIVPVELSVASIDGTWKLSQNKTEEVRQSAAKELSKWPEESAERQISDLMKLIDE